MKSENQWNMQSNQEDVCGVAGQPVVAEKTGLAGDMAAIREVLDDQQWAAFTKPVAVELKKGECTFHHPLTVHGSRTGLIGLDAPR